MKKILYILSFALLLTMLIGCLFIPNNDSQSSTDSSDKIDYDSGASHTSVALDNLL